MEVDLSPAQHGRLAQIGRQVRGPGALADATVQRALGLDPSQRAAVGALAADYRNEEGRYLDGAVDGDERKLQAELLGLREAAAQEIAAVLDRSQRVAWNDLLGPPVVGFDPNGLGVLRLVRRPARTDE